MSSNKKKNSIITYRVNFRGRLRGFIGITYRIEVLLEAYKSLTEEEIRVKLYEKYDHISSIHAYIQVTDLSS